MLTHPDRPGEGGHGSRPEPDPLGDDMLAAMLKHDGSPKSNRPPVYTARLPFRTCNFLSWQDGYAYAGWAGLRPMTELEFEKACRGPLNPVPHEHAWGSTEMVIASDLQDEGLPTERYGNGGTVSSSVPGSPPAMEAVRRDRYAAKDGNPGGDFRHARQRPGLFGRVLLGRNGNGDRHVRDTGRHHGRTRVPRVAR